jgi:hypothetical protein
MFYIVLIDFMDIDVFAICGIPLVHLAVEL